MEGYAIAAHVGDEDLVRHLNAALKDLRNQGFLDSLTERFIGVMN